MDAPSVLDELGLTAAGCAAAVTGDERVGFHLEDLVAPASVMKIQIAVAVENAIAAGFVDGSARRVMLAAGRPPGPVGISLMRDDVAMSVRDLVVAMLTISDNAATDELIDMIGLDAINRSTSGLGMARTHIASDLHTMLDAMAHEVGFPDYRALAAHHAELTRPPTADEIRRRLASSAALDPARGTRTTAAETVMLLQAIWTDRAGPPEACAAIRTAMGHQLTRHRIASGFGSCVAYAVAIFTRNDTAVNCEPAAADAGIGRIARALVGDCAGLTAGRPHGHEAVPEGYSEPVRS